MQLITDKNNQLLLFVYCAFALDVFCRKWYKLM